MNDATPLGARLLASYLNRPDVRRVAFAKAIGATPQAVRNWTKGERRPSVRYAVAMERETGGAVPVDAWV